MGFGERFEMTLAKRVRFAWELEAEMRFGGAF